MILRLLLIGASPEIYDFSFELIIVSQLVRHSAIRANIVHAIHAFV